MSSSSNKHYQRHKNKYIHFFITHCFFNNIILIGNSFDYFTLRMIYLLNSPVLGTFHSYRDLKNGCEGLWNVGLLVLSTYVHWNSTTLHLIIFYWDTGILGCYRFSVPLACRTRRIMERSFQLNRTNRGSQNVWHKIDHPLILGEKRVKYCGPIDDFM